ncbi:MAG: hypothetical protein ACPGWR_23465 [Ardenticatenaceae bacterium]
MMKEQGLECLIVSLGKGDFEYVPPRAGEWVRDASVARWESGRAGEWENQP